MVSKGKNVKSYVAVDQFEFLQTSACELHPPEAKPLTTPAPVTTPAPTEPPGRKYIILYQIPAQCTKIEKSVRKLLTKTNSYFIKYNNVVCRCMANFEKII